MRGRGWSLYLVLSEPAVLSTHLPASTGWRESRADTVTRATRVTGVTRRPPGDQMADPPRYIPPTPLQLPTHQSPPNQNSSIPQSDHKPPTLSQPLCSAPAPAPPRQSSLTPASPASPGLGIFRRSGRSSRPRPSAWSTFSLVAGSSTSPRFYTRLLRWLRRKRGRGRPPAGERHYSGQHSTLHTDRTGQQN